MPPDPRFYMALAEFVPDVRNDPKFSVYKQALEGLSHRDVFNAALNGHIEAERINGRWYVKRANRRKNVERLCALPKPRIGRPPRKADAPAAAKPARAKRAVPSSSAAVAT